MANTNDIITLELDESNKCDVHLHAHFGPWELGPQHGFARITHWCVKNPPIKTGDAVSATFELKDNDTIRQMWLDNRFCLLYTVIIRKNQLQLNFHLRNEGNNSFEFNTLFHTYLKTLDINSVTISGLQSLSYIEKAKPKKSKEENEQVAGRESSKKKCIEKNELVVVRGHMDRVYENSIDKNVITNLNSNKTVTMTRTNLPDIVVWNPWQEKAKVMSDFDDEEYKEMICVEAGYVVKPRSLSPGAKFDATLNFDIA